MAGKQSGLAWTTLNVGDGSNASTDIRNDVTNFQFATPRGVQDVTGLDKSAIERLLLLADFSATLNGVYNPTGAHLVFATVPSQAGNAYRMWAMTIGGKNLNMGTAGAGNGAILFTDYQLTRAQTGEFTYSVPGVLGNGSVPTWS